MKKVIKIQDLEKQNIFKTPENYFETLSMRIETKINKTTLPINKEEIFQLPEKHYFEKLSQKIITKTSQKSTNLFPQKQDIFIAPPQYFDWLPQKIKQRIKQIPKNKHTIPQRYALVPLIMSITAMLLFFMLYYPTNPAKTLLSQQDYARHLPKNNFTQLLTSGGKETKQYLPKNTQIAAKQAKTPQLATQNENQNWSKQEIIDYLHQHDAIETHEIITNLTTEKEEKQKIKTLEIDKEALIEILVEDDVAQEDLY
ncbi:MAG: hypothetical protein EAZ55_05245 [Cytophagales bacterium]|nr:MAG: hypothetical protein EAZ55_05245 [Cytophagales bacterium]